MSGGNSNYLRNKIIDSVLRKQAFIAAPTNYMALLTSTKGPIARSTVYAVNDTASFLAADGYCHLYKCTAQTGATAGSAPAFPGVPGEVITDGLVTWTEQDAALRAGTAMVEPTFTGYARVNTDPGTGLADWKSTQNDSLASTGTTGASSNTNAVTFGQSTAGPTAFVWGYATFDALTAGNPLWYGGLLAPKTINPLDAAPTFAPGAITYSEG